MKETLAVWLTRLFVCGCVFVAPTPACRAGPVLTVPTCGAADKNIDFVFVADSKKGADLRSISTYRTFINANVGGAAYNGGLVSWSAIGGKSSTAAIANMGSSDVPVRLSNGAIVATFRPRSADDLGLSSLDNPIDAAANDNGADDYLWTIGNVSRSAGLEIGERGRRRYTTFANDIYLSTYSTDATRHQSDASGNRLDTISEVLKVATEVAERSEFVLSIVCGSRGHFP